MVWWAWVILGVVALVGESVHMALFLLNVAVAAFAVALLALAVPLLPVQLTVFVALSFLLIGLARPRMLRALMGRREELALPDVAALAGRVGTVTDAVTTESGTIRIGKAEFWTARPAPSVDPAPGASPTVGPPGLEAGCHVRISAVSGLTAYVEPLPAPVVAATTASTSPSASLAVAIDAAIATPSVAAAADMAIVAPSTSVTTDTASPTNVPSGGDAMNDRGHRDGAGLLRQGEPGAGMDQLTDQGNREGAGVLPVPTLAPVTAPAPSFGALLKRYRLAASLTQEELAERAGLSVRAISDLERGLHRSPRKETVNLLADALRLEPENRIALEETGRSARTQGDARRR